MRTANHWLLVGLVAVVIVTAVVSGVVVASAVVSTEVADGDLCEPSPDSSSLRMMTPTDVATYVGTITDCISESEAPHRSANESPPTVPIRE